MKKVLITGGSGFIGSNLVRYFLNKNFKVINLDLLTYASTPDRFKNFCNNKRYKFIRGDIGDYKKVEKIMKQNYFSGIFNLASMSHVDRSIDSPKNFIKKNIFSNLEFIDLINYLYSKKNFKGKFVNVSTDEVYGSVEKSINEKANLQPNSPYSASKASIDLIIRAYNKTFNFPFINVRSCNNYGYFQFSEKFIPTIINCIFNDKKIPLYGDGKFIREWIYVEDFCSALNQIFLRGRVNSIYNVGTGHRITNLSLVKKIINLTNKIIQTNFSERLIHHVKDRPGHDRSYNLNSNKIKKEIKWQSQYNLPTGLTKTIIWYYKNSDWLRYTQKKYDGRRLGI